MTLRSIKNKLRNVIQCPRGIRSYGCDVSFPAPRKIFFPQFIEIGDRVTIGTGAILCPVWKRGEQTFQPALQIESDVYIGRNVQIACGHKISLGAGCVLSDHVYISDIEHGIHPGEGPILDQPIVSKGPVTIGKNSFLGYRSFVCPGVVLGEWCVVGAHSVVTKSFPAYSLIGGNPAKLIKRYSGTERQWVRV